MKRVSVEVCPKQGAWRWKVTVSGKRVQDEPTQAMAISSARLMIQLLLNQGKTVTLKIKRRDGSIREERTYPRSSDPRKSKG